MAIFHLAAKVVSRKAGQSVIAKAAYNAREELTEERTGEIKDYSRAQGLIFSGLYTPANAPEWAHDRAQLWNKADQAEKRKDAALAREYEVALPHELSNEQRRFLVQDFVKESFTRKGYAVDVCIHAPDRDGDERNYHAHILVTDRRLEAGGFAADKKERHFSATNRRNEFEAIREKWEHIANRHLERHGIDARIDRRSLKDQGIDREPTEHLGPYATQLERDGEESERGNTNRDIDARNQAREAAQREYEAAQAEREQWEEKINQAAIHKAEGEQKKERRAEQEAEQDKNKNAELGKAAADIRFAVAFSKGGESFAVALGNRGYTLAQVSEQEAAAFERAAAYAKEIGHYLPSAAANEVVAVNQFGGIHRLTKRTTGKTREEFDKYIVQIQRENLPTVTQARENLEQKRREREAKRDKNKNAELGKAAADIRFAVTFSKGGESFKAALAERCLVLSQVSEKEAAAFERAAAFAEELGHHAPRYNAGELVVISQFGGIHRLTERTTGKTREEFDKYLVQIQRENLPNTEQGKQEAVLLGQYKYRAALLEQQAQQKAELEKQQAERKEQREKQAKEFEEKTKQQIDAGLASKQLFDKNHLEKRLKENHVGFFGRTAERIKQYIGHKIDEHKAEKQKEKLHKSIAENSERNKAGDVSRAKRQDKAHERARSTVEIKQAEAREKRGIHAPERDEALKAAQHTATQTAFNKTAKQTTQRQESLVPTDEQEAAFAEKMNDPAEPKERKESALDKAIGAVGKGREAIGKAGREARKSINVIDKATGAVTGLGNGVASILDGIARPVEAFAEGLANMLGGASPADERKTSLERTLQAMEERAAREEALENICESLKGGDDISAADLRNLPREELERIRDGGDEYLQNMARQFERERDDWGRERER
ncbi:MAG: MobA/MobL family protein [Nitrospira sp.]|nr:MobA/MobL family protein [Nitrospira sp.]